MNLTAWVAFAAGLGSLFSPCVLPLLPSYLSTLAGAAAPHGDLRQYRGQLMLRATGFVVGFSSLLVASGLASTAVGEFLRRYQVELAQVGGVLVILFGLHFLGILELPGLAREVRPWWNRRGGGGFWPALVMGLAFTAGWTPCIGPIWASILILASQAHSEMTGAVLLFAYALGMGIPLWLFAWFAGAATRWVQRFGQWLPWAERASGLLLIGLGIALLTGWYTHALSYLA
ncbi:MAG: cytochrome c biogenesis protein CcdA [Firmicutes bacterium]|nr:cytochrome c biogenesis protein CcdA [Bacillota bacterium]